jgi:hypothetical protein
MLFCLKKLDVVPVDTHVYQIAKRDYPDGIPENTLSSLTPKLMKIIGDFFRQRFGRFAGWAHSILFAADLSNLQFRLPAELQKPKETKEQKMSRLQKEKDVKDNAAKARTQKEGKRKEISKEKAVKEQRKNIKRKPGETTETTEPITREENSSGARELAGRKMFKYSPNDQ